MFLELNEKGNNIILYSRNVFDPDENFTVIIKDAFQLRRRKMKYEDVLELINLPQEKNLIIYRLLTNYNSIKASDSKFGFVLMVDNKSELIYCDPVYALKDLPNLVKNFNLESFRFKIQQLGIKTLSFINGRENYTEIFSYDLHAIEAQNQNDKVFADAIFPEDTETAENAKQEKMNDALSFVEKKTASFDDNPVIKEDNSITNNLLIKPSIENTPQQNSSKLEQKERLKKLLSIDDGAVEIHHHSNFTGQENLTDLSSDPNSYSDLFKTTNKKERISEREKDSITLRLTISE